MCLYRKREYEERAFMNNRKVSFMIVVLFMVMPVFCMTACGGQKESVADVQTKESADADEIGGRLPEEGQPAQTGEPEEGQPAQSGEPEERQSAQDEKLTEGHLTQDGSANEEPSAETYLPVTETDVLPDGTWQAEVSFPDWSGHVDNTLAMNSMYSFEGRHGQGKLYVRLRDGIETFHMYVNGMAVETSGMTGGNSYVIDYSEAAIDGNNTIQVSGIGPSAIADAVKVCIPYPVVLDGTPEEAGLAKEPLQLIADLVASDVEYGFPGAQLAVIRGGRLVYENAWGSVNAYLPDGARNEESAPVTTDTLYDLASVTKMFSVNYALQKLSTDGRIDLDAKISDFLGERFWADTIEIHYEKGANPDMQTQKKWKAGLTIRDLLRHQGGFPADPRYFNPYLDTEKQKYDPNAENRLFAGNDGTQETRAATIEAICKTPLFYEPGTKTVYSDVDYMILGVVVEQVTGKDLDTYLKETFCEPMGLSHITYNPLGNGFAETDCAATELNGNTRDGYVSFPGIRTKTIQGQVHDEKAYYSMGGISGHAGLFSNASDLARLASVMLTGGYGNYRYFSRNVMDTFTAPKKEDAASWGLGWWREGDGERIWYFGTQAASTAIGHQGWTGTLVMIDAERDLVIVYLTNKINSPVTNGGQNPNRFDGGWYTASTLGFVPQILSIGMDSSADSKEALSCQLMDLLSDMADDSIRLIPQGAGSSHPAVKNAQSKLSLFRSRAEDLGDEVYLDMSDALQRRMRAE